MMTPEQQETLTRVGPGTPIGSLLRCYWLPIAISSQVKISTTRKVRVLCEDLLLFRTPNGSLGLIDEHCPHRRASLVCGLIDDEGIRCPYHGWKFNKNGACLEMPSEHKNPGLKDKVKTTSYPVEELGGFVFAYLGSDPKPLLPRYDLFVWDNVLRDIGQATIPCNWLQIMENSIDPIHFEWLHGHHLSSVRAQSNKSEPVYFKKHQIETGFEVFSQGIIKRRLLEGGSKEDDDWKIGHPLIFPLMLRVGAQNQHRFQMRVPVDDTTTINYWYSCYIPPTGKTAPVQQEIPAFEVPWCDQDGNYLLDFVDGGDMMIYISQGPIVDRTREKLVSSDKGIAMYRRLLLEQIKCVTKGKDPMGVIRDPNENICIEFKQEFNKFKAGKDFLLESIEMGHVRYSPIKDAILELLLS